MWRALEQLSQQVGDLTAAAKTPQPRSKRKQTQDEEEDDMDGAHDHDTDDRPLPKLQRKGESTPGKRFANRVAGSLDHDAVRAFMTDVSVSECACVVFFLRAMSQLCVRVVSPELARGILSCSLFAPLCFVSQKLILLCAQYYPTAKQLKALCTTLQDTLESCELPFRDIVKLARKSLRDARSRIMSAVHSQASTVYPVSTTNAHAHKHIDAHAHAGVH